MCSSDLLITDKQQSISETCTQPKHIEARLRRFFQDEFSKSEARLYLSEPVFTLHATLVAVMDLMTTDAIRDQGHRVFEVIVSDTIKLER